MEKPAPRLTEITLTIALTDEHLAAVDAQARDMGVWCGPEHPTHGTWTREQLLRVWMESYIARAADEQVLRTQMLVRAEQQQLERR